VPSARRDGVSPCSASKCCVAPTGPDTLQDAGTAASKAIGRFSRLDKDLYRGRQPESKGFEALARLGVKTIVCLRTHPQDDKKHAASLGMRVIELPMPSLGKPTVDQGMRFLSEATDPGNGKVFFHCTHGADRTGAAAAIYRICAQGWEVDKALAEMKERGCHWAFQQSKVSFVRDFAAAWDKLPEASRAEVLHR